MPLLDLYSLEEFSRTKLKIGFVTGSHIGGDLVRLRGVDAEIAHAHGEHLGGSVINATDAPISHQKGLQEGQLAVTKTAEPGNAFAFAVGAFAGAAAKKFTE